MKANIILLIFSTLLTLIAAEVLLRAVGYYGARGGRVESTILVDDPILDYRFLPNSSYIKNNIEFATNSHGWRDIEHVVDKPYQTCRLLVLGDSVTFGYGVPMESAYSRILDEQLASTLDFAIETITIGVSGANLEQEVHLLESEGLRYDPDLVVLGYVLNDPEVGTSLRAEMAQGQSFFASVKEIAQYSSVANLIYKGGQQAFWMLRVYLGSDVAADYVETDYFNALHSNAEGRERIEASFDRLKSIAASSDRKYLVAIFPVFHELDDYAWTSIHDYVSDLALEAGLQVIDLLSAYAEYPASELQVESGDHVHPNVLGHQVAANALFEGLMERRSLESCIDDGLE